MPPAQEDRRRKVEREMKRRRLAARRKAVGHSQEQLADRIGVERSTIVRWEAGDTEPQPWLRPKLARALQVSVDDLHQLLSEATDCVDVPDERLNYALEHPHSVDLITAARLRQQVETLDEGYDRAPSTLLLAEAGKILGQVGFLRFHALTSRVQRELYSIEAEAAILMGQLVWDASQRRDHETAKRYLDQAIDAARQLRHPAMQARATLRKSFVSLYGEKNPTDGLQLAMQTADLARPTSNVLTGLAVLHVAEAHAMRGDAADCKRALGDAETLCADVTDADVAIELFSSTQHSRLAGSCLLSLGDAKGAEQILDMTARELQDGSKAQAVVLGNLTLAHIRQSKVDEAVAALHRAIDVVEGTWGGGGLNIIFGAGRELRFWRQVPAVHDVHDRLLGLMATA